MCTFTWRCLRCAGIWLCDGLRLLLFTLALLTAFVQFAWYYWVSSDRLVVRYGTESMRQHLDVYPANCSSPSIDRQAQDRANGYISRRRRADDPQAVLSTSNTPVVFFCCGGAWILGHKMWGALTARALVAAGVTVVAPDYRNYPWGTVPQAVADVELALQWTLDRMDMDDDRTSSVREEELNEDEETPPDPYPLIATSVTNQSRSTRKKKIIVVGQSAGGHLVMTLILRKAVEKMKSTVLASLPYLGAVVSSSSQLHSNSTANRIGTSSFLATDLCGLIALSAPFNLTAMQSTFQKHGLDEHLVDRIFGGQRDDYDPFHILQEAAALTQSQVDHHVDNNASGFVNNINNHHQLQLRDVLPPMHVYHGSRDQTVPEQGSIDFVAELQRLGVTAASYHSYSHWSHTDPILERPMEADHRFHHDIVNAIHEWTGDNGDDTEEAEAAVVEWPREGTPAFDVVSRKLSPRCLIQLARCFMPF